MRPSALQQSPRLSTSRAGSSRSDGVSENSAPDLPEQSVLKDSLIKICEQLNALTRTLSPDGPTPIHSEAAPSPEDCAAFAKSIVANYRDRTRFFPADLFVDPAWNLTLDLFVSEVEGKRISVSSALIVAGIPSTTALRLLERLVELGLLVKTPDATDRRRIYVTLSDTAFRAVAEHLGNAILRAKTFPAG
jgi:Winged helix DNA-binding domain